MNRFAKEDPDLLIGWNVVGFDLRFLEQKCRQYGLPFALGRAGLIADIRERSGGDRASLPGRVVLDGPMTLRGAFYNFEDLSLETVSLRTNWRRQTDWRRGRQDRRNRTPLPRGAAGAGPLQSARRRTGAGDLPENRTDGAEHAPYGDLRALARPNRTERARLRLLHAATAASQRFRRHRPDRRTLCRTGPRRPCAAADAGLYHQVITLDFRSLYPSIIRTFHIDPYAHRMADLDPLHTPVGGYRFSRRESLLPDFIGDLFEQRAQAKREGDSHLSMAIKILMNSFYGVMGSPGCRFYHPDLPNAITRTGQWLLRESIAWLERAGYRTLYGDTDSLFIQLREDDFGRADERAAELAAEPLAYRSGLGIGDVLPLRTERGMHDFPIVGVYYDYTSDRGVIRMSYTAYREFWDDAAISSLALYVQPGVDVEGFVAELRERFGAREELVIGSNVALRTGTLAIFDRTFAITAVLQLLATIVAFIGILSALMALQLERARELGMLRANGLTPGQLWGLVLSQTGLMGLTAGLLALPLGVALALVLVYVINRRSFGWTLDLALDPLLFVQALGVALVAALLAGIYPALKMARTSPALALREE
ncbi:FtsX-like permease family protein [Candidatus Gracilibacteria bacterium]|nr:FtsX-like permease family protein [Candidatus Gracilibacteria bacterium]